MAIQEEINSDLSHAGLVRLIESAARKINNGGYPRGPHNRQAAFHRLLTKREIHALAKMYRNEIEGIRPGMYFTGIPIIGIWSAITALLKYEDRKKKAKAFRSRKTVRRLVMERDRRQCRSCGSTEDLTLDHIHPTIYGGEDWTGNLQVLCRSCNSSKGTKLEDEQ